MTEEDQHLACLNARLFSRVEPAHKSKIVDNLQKEGAVSAMVRGRALGGAYEDAPVTCVSHRTYTYTYTFTMIKSGVVITPCAPPPPQFL